MSGGQHEVGGEVAIEITRELADPVRSLRDRLGLVVDGCAFELRLMTSA